MNAVEFSSKIEKGKIIVPKQFKEFENENVRVIMLFNEVEVKNSKKENLLLTLNKMKSEKMFSSIQNPVSWQKQVRDDWE
jgi:hypothetical protein